MESGNIVSRGNTVVKFLDQYGDERIIHRNRGQALRIKSKQDTISHILNRTAGAIVGARIKKMRLAKGLTLEGLISKAGLVAATGCAKHRMYEIESAGKGRAGNHTQGVRLGTLYALALALECSLSDLMPTPQEVARVAGVALAPLIPEVRVHKHQMAAE